MEYAKYHKHPLNKGIHIVAIPIIFLSSYNLLSLIKINFKIKNIFETNINLRKILVFLMLCNYLRYGIRAFSVMCVYFYIMDKLSVLYMKKMKNSVKNSIYGFTYGWVIQLMGHYIEGEKPALMDGIFQAFNEAPLFSVSYILPFKIV